MRSTPRAAPSRPAGRPRRPSTRSPGLLATLAAGLTLLGASGLAPSPAAAQGWIEPPGTLRSWQVVKTRSDVRVTVTGRVARFEVTEWFRNEGGRVAEGHYLYPLPGEAVFQGFSLFQGDLELRGEIMDAEEARRIYEEIVRRKADPALIELAGHGLLRARVFPIQPGEERKVTIRYTQVLARAGDALQLLYAGAVRGDARQADPRPRPLPEGPRVRPLPADPPDRGTPPGPLAAGTSFHLVVQDGASFLQPFSPTHALTTRREAGRLEVRLAEPLTGRLSLFLPLAGDRVGLSLATHRPHGEDGYFLLTLTPDQARGPAVARDVTVVLDVSGSMSGGKLAQAKAALRQLLATLSPEDRFRLLSFSNQVRLEATGWSAAGDAELARARGWIDRLVADGGTNIGAALEAAFAEATPDARLPVVVFLTDGLPSVGEKAPERLADLAEAAAGRARVFAFGVGHDVNTHLLDRLGEAGRGATEYVEPGEDVERALSLLAAKVRHPVLTDLEIAGSPVRLEEMYPVRLPDLFAGEELVLFGRYSGEGEGPLRIRGRIGDETRTFQAGVAFPAATEANGWIPRLWASRKLGHLTRQVWTEGSSEDLVREIRALALRYGLPSEHTSYLVTEPDAVTQQGGPLRGAAGAHPPLQAPASPGAASGAGAVRRAEEARLMRETASMADLATAEAELRDRLEEADAAGGTRMVGGRVFVRTEGRWEDRSRPAADRTREIRAYSSAWFALMKALPELRPVLRALEEVTVAGEDVNLAFGAGGAEDLSDREVRALVRSFRGA